ncbi:MAG: hypothetical protein IPN67_20190 [Bacteroidales bacterium]|nr:hypothetical protein [Bacteroidales bacterium]
MKKTIKPGVIIKAAFLILFLVILNSCNRDRNNPGWDYFPDMFYSTAYESFTKNPNFKDGITMRVPAEGSVPRDYTPLNILWLRNPGLKQKRPD